jgi:hypothetical protein
MSNRGNPKFEFRNPKQIQMIKKQKILIGSFGILNFGFMRFGLFRIWCFGFRVLLIKDRRDDSAESAGAGDRVIR